MTKLIITIFLLTLSFSSIAEIIAICANKDMTVRAKIVLENDKLTFEMVEKEKVYTFTSVKDFVINEDMYGYLASNKWKIPQAALLFTNEEEESLRVSNLIILKYFIPKTIKILCETAL